MTTLKEERLAFMKALFEEPRYKMYRSTVEEERDGILLTLTFTLNDTFPDLLKDPTCDEESRRQLLIDAATSDCKALFKGSSFEFSTDHLFEDGVYIRSYTLAYDAPRFEEEVRRVVGARVEHRAEGGLE